MPERRLLKACKAACPQWLKSAYRRFKFRTRERRLAVGSNQEIFDRIYLDGAWGRGNDGVALSGSGSHEPKIIGPYISALSNFFDTLDSSPVVVDLGCGDFNVGEKLCDRASHYIACDVSLEVLRRNSTRDLPNVSFSQLDITKDVLPKGDVAIVRQVLQHLSNKEIVSFVRRLNIERSFNWIIITEHVPIGNFAPNRDKPVGPGIRLSIKSGVDITRRPFDMQFIESNVICEVEERNSGLNGVIRTTVFRLK